VGTSAAAGLACALLLAAPPPARAETPCTGITASGGRFATCFDPGNRLFVSAGIDGYGGGIALRHVLRFDDEPDLIWKLEHQILEAHFDRHVDRYHAVVYTGRYLRHARDGHIVLPFSIGKKIFLPFDIGADAEVGRFSGRIAAPHIDLGVVRTAALIDLSRSESFRRRLCFGAVVRWDARVQREPLEVAEHVVAPLTLGVVEAHAESQSGLTVADVRFEGGKSWSIDHGWRTDLSARLSLERILVAINDRPISLILGGHYRGLDEELYGEVAVRFALVQRMDRRVVLRPLVAD
jgi:hypothetical protein